jgi:phosphopantetheine--protein transferase-like protein
LNLKQADIAIVGMACIFPGAPNLEKYWENIVSKVDSISDPPSDWGADDVFDPDSTASDRVYCKRGGYLNELTQFDPLAYGVMPRAVDGGEPEHFLALRVAHEAIGDAGYLDRPFNRDRAAVILGRGTFLNRGSVTALQHGLVVDQTLRVLKQLHPEYSDKELHKIRQDLKASLPPFNAETAPGLVSNIMCGRIANRLDLRGPSYAVDAACASSLIAVDHGMRELVSGRCDLALVGGVSVSTPSIVFMVFCQLGALSRRGRIRPFDKDADGTLLGEGLGMAVLKRREDAERDGDRIYAIVKGVGISSDGRGLAVLAPQVGGEELALRRAYEVTGISPNSIDLIEAHGTGTSVGDQVEIEALSRVFGLNEHSIPRCALGTVKSMISHTIPAAGIAGLIKVALALHHKILPPTINCDRPSPRLELEKTPFYINTEPRPWINGRTEPRRAGVNAFGFGGINTHAIVEEYLGCNRDQESNYLRLWETEVLILEAESRQGLVGHAEQLHRYLSTNPEIPLRDLAFTLNSQLDGAPYRLAVVASTLKDFGDKLAYALKRLADPGCTRIKDRSGVFFFEKPLSREGTLAFLFPGEGSQYANMLADLCLHFPEVRNCFDRADRVFLQNKRNILPSQIVFPPTLLHESAKHQLEQQLWQTDCAVAAVFAADRALWKLLTRLGIHPHAVLGHSSGEYAALAASGAVQMQEEEDELLQYGLDLNTIYDSFSGQIPKATLMTVGATNRTLLSSLLAESAGSLYLAMDNCPNQLVLCGDEAAISSARNQLQNQGALCTLLPFDRAYHTHSFEPVCRELSNFFDRIKIMPPRILMYSCASAAPYPQNPNEIRKLAVDQWALPVRFRETIERLFDDGVRIFVEVGPRGNLTGFVEDTLRKRDYVAIPSNVSHRSGITQLNYLVGLLAAHGVPLSLNCLYSRRAPQSISFEVPSSRAVKPKERGTSMRVALALPRLAIGQRNQSFFSNAQPPLLETLSTVGNINMPTNGHVVDRKDVSRGEETQNAQMASFAEVEQKSHGLATVFEEARSPNLKDPSESRSQVMQEYLQTMEQFLITQEKVMEGFMSRNGTSVQVTQIIQPQDNKGDQLTSASAVSEFPALAGPFNIVLSSLTPNQDLVATCRLDLDEHYFLRHHTIGGRPSNLDATRTALPIVPLSIMLEIMAQVASFLSPDRQLLGMKNVRAHRWIVVQEQQRELLLAAKRRNLGTREEIDVKILEPNGAKDREGATGDASIVEGTMVFGDEYPARPAIETFALRSERPYRFRPEQYYREVMFHGPSFQSVVSINRSGENGAEATVRVPPELQLFRSNNNPRLLTDPVLLDAAGQVVGFWTADRLETGFVVFPIGFDSLDLYGPWPLGHDPIKCQAQSRLLDDGHIRSHIDFLLPGDQLLARLVGWKDMRFDFARHFVRFVLSPRDVVLSTPWSAPIFHFPSSTEFRCYRLDRLPDALFETEDTVWPRAWARLILTREEQDAWFRMIGPKSRRKEWLLGRLAAKDATRSFIKERYEIDLCPADIEIVADSKGRPTVKADLLEKLGCHLLLSIAHSGGEAVAIVGTSDTHHGVGIDIEVRGQRGRDLEEYALTSQERHLLATNAPSNKEEWLLRFWCAKEAVAKALGEGMQGSPLNLVVQTLEAETGRVEVGLTGELSRKRPELAGTIFHAYTESESSLVFATSLI